MKKVCFVRHSYYPGDVRVRKETLALIEKGYQVDIISLGFSRQKRRETVNGVNIYRLPLQHIRGGIPRYLYEYLAFFFLASLMLCILYFKNRYDVIQINTLPDFDVFIALIPKLFGAKVVLDLHEPAPELWCSTFGLKNKRFFNIIAFIEQMSIRFADRAITVTEQMKNNYINRGADPLKISVILNVPNNNEINHEAFKYSPQNDNDNKFILISHGFITKRYGQHIAIKAIAILKDKVPNIQLNILGWGDHIDELKELVSSLEIDTYVKFLGFLPFDEMVKNIAAANIGLVPVEKNDYSVLVHTNKMFEYIAIKKPVIITRLKAVEDFFGSDDSCLKYFKSGDEKDFARCVIELYNNPENREIMTHNAFERFQAVNWEVMKEKYSSIFKELLSE